MSALFQIGGHVDKAGITWRIGSAWEANALLRDRHYLGPLKSGARLTIIGDREGEPVAAMMWKHPTSRRLPADGSWLELSRWCLTPEAGENAGSRMHRWSVKIIGDLLSDVTTLVSYSDPVHGHTGALYRACNWRWAPTWHRLRPPPTGQGDWGAGRQEVKDRWVFSLKRDRRYLDALAIDDPAAVRFWQANGTEAERGWARLSPTLSVDVDLAHILPGDRADIRGVIDAGHVMPIANVDVRSPQVPNTDVLTVDANAGLHQRGEQVARVGFIPTQIHVGSVA